MFTVFSAHRCMLCSWCVCVCARAFFQTRARSVSLPRERERARSLSHTHTHVNARFVSLFLCHTPYTQGVAICVTVRIHGQQIWTHELWVSYTIP
jgi:Fe-S-cluster-containing hydrogenase component 2